MCLLFFCFTSLTHTPASQAEASYKLGLTSELVFAVTVWALLLATLLSPLALRRCMLISERLTATKQQQLKSVVDDGEGTSGVSTASSKAVIGVEMNSTDKMERIEGIGL
jgi:hypothetical protein